MSQSQFDDFLQERRYLLGISTATEEWYRQTFKWLQGVELSKLGLTSLIVRMREAGLKPSAVNSRIIAINAYLRWRELGSLCLGKLKEPQLIHPTLKQPQIQILLAWKPKGWYQRRMQTLALTLLDGGLRISEALSLHKADVDLENLVLKVWGKGGKERLIPISLHLRKVLYLYLKQSPQLTDLLFPARSGGPMLRREALKSWAKLSKRLGLPSVSLHGLRRSFAASYLRSGGNVEYLRRILGHASLVTTQKYLRSLGVEDLREVHTHLSPLAAK